MRKEYHLKDETHNKSLSIYGKKDTAIERFNKVKDWYSDRGIVLGLYEVFFVGCSFHHAIKLM